jgi:hypothetical protein
MTIAVKRFLDARPSHAVSHSHTEIKPKTSTHLVHLPSDAADSLNPSVSPETGDCEITVADCRLTGESLPVILETVSPHVA